MPRRAVALGVALVLACAFSLLIWAKLPSAMFWSSAESIDVERGASAARAVNTMIFVDKTVASVTDGYDPPKGMQIVMLGDGRDPLREMADALKDVRELKAIHLLSHGERGALKIGGRVYDRALLAKNYAQDLAIIGRALAPDGDLLLYGCDLADGAEGRALVAFLAASTGADIAASRNLTGQGGDWGLEVRFGDIEAPLLTFQDWKGHLWTTEVWETGWYGDACTSCSPPLSALTTLPERNATPRIQSASGVLAATGVTLNMVQIGTQSVQQLSGVTATTEAASLSGDDYFYATIVANSPGITINRMRYQRVATNGSTAQMRMYLYDTVTGANTPIATTINPDGATGYQEMPMITPLIGLVPGRSYQLRFYFWNCTVTHNTRANSCFVDNPEIYSMLDQAPTAVNDSFTTSFQTPVSGSVTAANPTTPDSDPENHTLTLDQINGAAITVGTPITLTNGTLTITNATNGQFTFVPNQGFTGTQTFTYRINDGFGLNATATVTINVAASTVVATNDTTTRMESALAQPNVLNVRTGDTINGAAATASNSTLALVGSLPPELTFDPATGAVGVMAGAAPGSYSFTYRICSSANSFDCKTATATVVVQPKVTITKTSAPYSDPVNGTTNPKLIPGGFVAYTITVSNPSSVPVDANSVIITDPTAAQLDLFVGNYTGASGGPVIFTQGSPSSTLTYTYTSLASTTDDVEFSNDNGATWTYVPVVGANGTDINVTTIRIRPKGAMAANSSFSVTFRYYLN